MRLRILLAEDDPDIRSVVRSALQEAGHEAVDVGDGARAAERISAEFFDVVVSDVRLPKLDGLAVFRHARQISPRTAVILMTSYGAVTDAVTALKQGRTTTSRSPSMSTSWSFVSAGLRRNGSSSRSCARRARSSAARRTQPSWARHLP